MKKFSFKIGSVFLVFVALLGTAHAQQQPSVRQSGSVTANHVVLWVGNNLIKDGGGAAGTGTVTSVAASSDNILFPTSISGSPITTAGTFALNPLSHAANLFYATPNGTSGTPVFRAITGADIPLATTTTDGVVSVPSAGGLVVTAGALAIGNPSPTVLGGIFGASSASSNAWVQYVDTAGTQHFLQPNFSNLAGTAAIGQGGTGLTTLGSANACLVVNSSRTGYTFNTACTGSPLTNINIGPSSAPNPAIATDASSGVFQSTSPSTVGIAIANTPQLSATSTGITLAHPLPAGSGGTGQNSSAASGIAQVASGVWSFATALANGTTATTQTAGDTTTHVATDQFVATAVTNGVAPCMTQTVSNAASITFTGVPSGYNQYVARITNIVPANGNVSFNLQYGEGGVTKLSGYSFSQNFGGSATSQGVIELTTNNLNTSAGGNLSGTVWFNALQTSGVYKTVVATLAYNSGTFPAVLNTVSSGNYTGDTNVIDDLIFTASSGNISGTISLYCYH